VALPLPVGLSPSKLERFTHCALAFRFSYIDQLPEPPSLQQVRGTLVHRALQLLHAVDPPAERTPSRALACLGEAVDELSAHPDLAGLGLDGEGRERLVRDAEVLIGRYFSLEDPTEVKPVGLELRLSAELEQVELRGIIDRLDLLPSGELVVVDYKTGRSPSIERARARLAGVQFYAYLCEQVLSVRPVEVRLLYLRDQVVVSGRPSEQSMRGLRQRALAVWRAIERACAAEDFRPSPSSLCRWCSFQAHCPAFSGRAAASSAGGAVVELPTPSRRELVPA